MLRCFFSFFNKNGASGTATVYCGKYLIEMDVKHNMLDYGRKFWVNRGSYFIDFYVPRCYIVLASYPYPYMVGAQGFEPRTNRL